MARNLVFGIRRRVALYRWILSEQWREARYDRDVHVKVFLSLFIVSSRFLSLFQSVWLFRQFWQERPLLCWLSPLWLEAIRAGIQWSYLQIWCCRVSYEGWGHVMNTKGLPNDLFDWQMHVLQRLFSLFVRQRFICRFFLIFYIIWSVRIFFDLINGVVVATHVKHYCPPR